MPKFGLLIDYDYCIGCKTCEVACKMEHSRPADEYGIRVQRAKEASEDEKIYYIPRPTDKCDLCGRRRAKGEKTSCEKHCWTGAIKFGTIDDLAGELKKRSKLVVWVPH